MEEVDVAIVVDGLGATANITHGRARWRRQERTGEDLLWSKYKTAQIYSTRRQTPILSGSTARVSAWPKQATDAKPPARPSIDGHSVELLHRHQPERPCPPSVWPRSPPCVSSTGLACSKPPTRPSSHTTTTRPCSTGCPCCESLAPSRRCESASPAWLTHGPPDNDTALCPIRHALGSQGDITRLEVDCIVNAANPSLLGTWP